jgi:hypothetical protein
MMRISLATLALGTLCLGAACKHMDPSAASLSQRTTRYAVPYNTVAFLDADLTRNLVAEETGTKRSPTNTLVAWALLRNRTDETVKVSVRTRFFDTNKAPLDDTPWSMVYLDRRGLQTYETPSLRGDAAYYYIEIMKGR